MLHLYRIMEKSPKISLIEAKEEYMKGVEEEFRERREKRFKKALENFEQRNLIYTLDGDLYFTHSEDAEVHICRCDTCGKYFLIIDYKENEMPKECAYELNETYEIEDERINEDWQLWCPRCNAFK